MDVSELNKICRSTGCDALKLWNVWSGCLIAGRMRFRIPQNKLAFLYQQLACSKDRGRGQLKDSRWNTRKPQSYPLSAAMSVPSILQFWNDKMNDVSKLHEIRRLTEFEVVNFRLRKSKYL